MGYSTAERCPIQKYKLFPKIPNQLVCPTYDARRYGNCASGKMTLTGGFILGDFAVLMLLMLTVSTLASSIPLPFIFKMGGGKREGRLIM